MRYLNVIKLSVFALFTSTYLSCDSAETNPQNQTTIPPGTVGPRAELGLPTYLPPAPPEPEVVETIPSLLSRTGLYQNMATRTLAAGVRPYKPNYELWSDGAEKARYLSLPAGQKIDTSNMDRWVFPVGTKLWKEFRRDGKLIETRLIWKKSAPMGLDSGWVMETYVWDDQERDAALTIGGVTDARGTAHDVPKESDCPRCHRPELERPIGVSAIQLSGAGNGVRLRTLVDEQALTAPPANPDGFVLPGDATARAALGYLHANCGHCHAPDSDQFMIVDMSLRLEVGKLASVAMTPAYVTTVNQLTQSTKGGTQGQIRIKPGNPSQSALYYRMGIRLVAPESLQMPPAATEVVDTTGRAAVGSWIMGL